MTPKWSSTGRLVNEGAMPTRAKAGQPSKTEQFHDVVALDLYASGVTDPEDILGYWWLPQTPDVRVPGLLSMNSKPPKLRLLGEVAPATDPDGGRTVFASYAAPVIYGNDGLSGQAVTVFDAEGPSQPVTSGFSVSFNQSLNISGAITLGGHLESQETPQATANCVVLAGLDHWLGVGTHTSTHVYGETTDSTGHRWPVETRKAGIGPIALDHNTSLKVVSTYHHESFHDERGSVFEIQDNAVAQFTYLDPQPIATVLDNVRILMDLVTFFSGSASWIQKQEITIPGKEGVEIHHFGERQGESPTLSELTRRTLVHSVDMNSEDVVRRWFDFNRSGGRSSVNVLNASRYKDNQYVETDFLNVMTALEAIYSSISPSHAESLPRKVELSPRNCSPSTEPNIAKTKLRDLYLSEQLDSLVGWVGEEQLSPVVPSELQDAWRVLAVKARNDLVHEGQFKTRLTTSGLGALTRGVRWLLNLAVMKHLGIPDDTLISATRLSVDGTSATFTTREHLSEFLVQ